MTSCFAIPAAPARGPCRGLRGRRLRCRRWLRADGGQAGRRCPRGGGRHQEALEQKFPGAEVRGVTKTHYFGLYEVQFDDRIVYTDAKAKYVVVGAIYDTESKTNLTEERQRKLNRVNVASLPLDLAMKKVKGNGERMLYVFSDADCPFCAQARARDEVASTT